MKDHTFPFRTQCTLMKLSKHARNPDKIIFFWLSLIASSNCFHPNEDFLCLSWALSNQSYICLIAWLTFAQVLRNGFLKYWDADIIIHHLHMSLVIQLPNGTMRQTKQSCLFIMETSLGARIIKSIDLDFMSHYL